MTNFSSARNSVCSLVTVTSGNLRTIRRRLMASNYFFKSPFSVLGRHILGCFEEFEAVFELSFAEIRDRYLTLTSRPADRVPDQEHWFFKSICDEFLGLEYEPYQQLLTVYEETAAHLKQIQSNLERYRSQKISVEQALKQKKDQGSPDVEANQYQLKLLIHYIEKNSRAEREILSFLTSDESYDLAYIRSLRQYPVLQFSRSPYPYTRLADEYDLNDLSPIKNKFLDLSPRKHRDLEQLYQRDRSSFEAELAKYIEVHEIVNQIRQLIASNHNLDQRKVILLEALEAFEHNRELIFLNLIPQQIEGIFFDYGIELGIPESKLAIVGLVEKLERITEADPDFHNAEYYMFKFPLQRNQVAHGKHLNSETIEYDANFLLLDLYDVCQRITAKNLVVNQTVALVQAVADGKWIPSDLIKLALAQETGYLQTFPEFYNLEESIEGIQASFGTNSFLESLHQVISLNSPILNWAIEKIINYLKAQGTPQDRIRDLFTALQQSQSLVGATLPWTKRTKMSIQFAEFCERIDQVYLEH